MYTILILHGWGSCAKNWSQVKELLENQGCKGYVPDLPGFGKNPPPEKAWSIGDYVEWVREFCEKQGLSQVFLVGHSFGGRIAVKFTIKYPEELRKLILCAPSGITPRRKTKIFLFSILAKIGNAIFSLPLLKKIQPLVRKVIYFIIREHDYYLAPGIMKETLKKVVKEDLKPYLDQIKTSTLIIWGEKDTWLPVSDAYILKKEIKNSTLEIIPNVDHGINLEAPEILAEKILNFLKS